LSIEKTVVGVRPGRRKVCLREHHRAMARRRRQLAYNYVPVAPMLARIFAWVVVGATDVRASKTVVRRSRRRRTVCASVRERWGDGTGRLPTLCYRLHRHVLTSWRGCGHDRFCHREQVLGLCRWRRTVYAEVGDRWRDGAASLLTMGFNHTDARMLAWEVDVPDSRLSRNGDGAVPAVAHSLRECRAAIVRRRKQFAYLGYPFTTMLAHTLAPVVDAADFRLSRNGDGALPAAAHSLRACREAMARRPGRFGDLGLSGHYEACTHVGAGGRRGRFSTVQKR
jgi:hypothetical protein